MEKYVSYKVLLKVNDNCYFAHCLFSFSLMLLTTQSLLHFIFQFLIWNILKRTVENQEFYLKVLDLEKTGTQKRQICGDAWKKLAKQDGELIMTL